jgi:hypothetical protein
MKAADPSFEPARAAVPAYVHPLDDADAPVALIGDARTGRVADLFDATYETTLQALARYFVHTSETTEQVELLARTAMRLMERALKPLGIALTSLPLTEDPAGPRAGPGFTIISPTFYLLPHRNAAWRVIRQRIADLARRADDLATTEGLSELAPVATMLQKLHAEVAAAT